MYRCRRKWRRRTACSQSLDFALFRLSRAMGELGVRLQSQRKCEFLHKHNFCYLSSIPTSGILTNNFSCNLHKLSSSLKLIVKFKFQKSYRAEKIVACISVSPWNAVVNN